MSCVPEPMKSLAIPRELLATRRFRFLEQADRSIIRTVQCGVIYVMAFWSGPARLAFAELKRSLAIHDPGGQIELVVVDTDGSPDLYVMPEFSRGLGGWGESAWVKNGALVDVAYGSLDYEAKIKLLLNEQEVS